MNRQMVAVPADLWLATIQLIEKEMTIEKAAGIWQMLKNCKTVEPHGAPKPEVAS